MTQSEHGSTVRPPTAVRRVEGLDALRGLAVLLVMIRHMAPTIVGGAGIVGVTIFFALSGYLITGLLSRDLKRTGRIRGKRFYAHRAFRLYPALLLLLLFFIVAQALVAPYGDRANDVPTLLMGITYTSDLPLPWHMSAGFTHLWTLAVEEQFYLIWPFVLYLAVRAGANLRLVSMVVALLLTLVCWATLAASSSPSDIYERPTTWMSALAIGGLAFLVREPVRRMLGVARPYASSLAFALLLALAALPDLKDQAVTYIVGPTLIAVAACILIYTVGEWTALPSKWLRPFLWLGTISYGAYLWNLPVVELYREVFPLAPRATLVLTIPLTIAFALISWYSVEYLGRRLRAIYDARSVKSIARLGKAAHG